MTLYVTHLLGVMFVAVAVARAGELTVFQDLDEATARIARMADKPHDRLIDERGHYQSETLIFTDVKTGHEVWSLTMEHATELANIERRPVWSADGSVFSMKGNRAFRQLDGTIYKTRWAGHNFLMEGDLTSRRKLWAKYEGHFQGFNAKFDTWSNLTPRRLFYVIEDKLFQVDVGRDGQDNTATLLWTFPNNRPKILQNISDNDLLLVQDKNGDKPDDAPLFYVIDVKQNPPRVLSRSFHLGGVDGVEGHDPLHEYHVHSISIDRAGTAVSWNYGPADSEGEYVGWTLQLSDFDAMPAHRSVRTDPFGQYLSHPGVGPGDSIAYFGGPATIGGQKTGGWSLWARRGDSDPIEIGGPAPGGHATWAGFDPDTFFANVSRDWPDKPYAGTIVAGPGSWHKPQLRILAHAYDRQRGGKAGFDAIPRPTQSPDATKCWFHSSMLMPDDTFTGSFIVVYRRPHAPTQLAYADGVLQWTPHALSREVRQWLVYRRTAEGWGEIAAVPRPTLQIAVEPGTYMVAAVEWSGMASDTSSPVLDATTGQVGQAVRNWDTTPPAPPGELRVARDDAGRPRLTWTPPPDADVRHYHLYCSTDGPPQPVQARRFASPPAGTTTYLDWSNPHADAHYAITAVDRHGHESPPTHAR